MTHRDLTDEQNAALRAEIVRWWTNTETYAGATDEEVARAIAATGLVSDVDRSTIARIRNGKGGGSIMLALAICAARRIEISQIMGQAWADRFYGTVRGKPAVGRDLKRLIQESPLYLEMPVEVQRAFDTIADRYTSSADAERSNTATVLTKRLLSLKDDYDAGVLPPADELLPGAVLFTKPDPDAPQAATSSSTTTRDVSSGSDHARSVPSAAKPSLRASGTKADGSRRGRSGKA